MRPRPAVLARCVAACLFLCLGASRAAPTATPTPLRTAPVPCAPGQSAINEEGYLRLGGIEQWVTIKGADCANPVILFVHGGPGNPNTVFAALPYTAWEKEFTLVQWDQRGAGRTFARNPPAPDEHLTIEAMARDGNELAAWLGPHLQSGKVILFGGSWGSALSVHMAKARPELFAAYVGTGQLVRHPDNARAAYQKALAQAKSEGDTAIAATISALGEPPWVNPRNAGIFTRAARALEAKRTMPAPPAWFALASEYDTPAMRAAYEAAEDYSWIEFVGMQGDGMLSRLDLTTLGADFGMPVYLIHGEQDLTTVPDIARRYFDAIRAPDKGYFSLPRTGHAPNPEMIAMQIHVLRTKARPLAVQAKSAR